MDTITNMPTLDGYIPLTIEFAPVPSLESTIITTSYDRTTASDSAVEKPIEPTGSNIDTFLENISRNVLEEQNTKLLQDIASYKDRCESLQALYDQAFDERDSARNRISILKNKISALEEDNFQKTKRLETELRTIEKESRRKLNEAKRDLKEEKTLGDEARDALKEEQRLVAQSEQQNERLKRRVEKLEGMLASEHDRNKEHKFELEQLRGEMQRRVFSHEMPHMQDRMPHPSHGMLYLQDRMPHPVHEMPSIQYPMHERMHGFDHQ